MIRKNAKFVSSVLKIVSFHMGKVDLNNFVVIITDCLLLGISYQILFIHQTQNKRNPFLMKSIINGCSSSQMLVLIGNVM